MYFAHTVLIIGTFSWKKKSVNFSTFPAFPFNQFCHHQRLFYWKVLSCLCVHFATLVLKCFLSLLSHNHILWVSEKILAWPNWKIWNIEKQTILVASINQLRLDTFPWGKIADNIFQNEFRSWNTSGFCRALNDDVPNLHQILFTLASHII